MIEFIKNYDLKIIRKKIVLLFILNITDIVFSLILLKTDYFVEGNPLLKTAVQSLNASLYIKILLPALLLAFLYYRIKDATIRQLKISNILLNIIVGFYALINCFHLLWIVITGLFLAYINLL